MVKALNADAQAIAWSCSMYVFQNGTCQTQTAAVRARTLHNCQRQHPRLRPTEYHSTAELYHNRMKLLHSIVANISYSCMAVSAILYLKLGCRNSYLLFELS